MRFPICLAATLFAAILGTSQALAATATVRDGSTLQLGNVTYRLDGIDAPPVDQICIDEHADSWTCGLEARDQLTRLIGGRQVRCDDLGADPDLQETAPRRLQDRGRDHQPEPVGGRQRFCVECRGLRDGAIQGGRGARPGGSQGLWKGCFVAPQEFRRGKKDGPLLGGSCPAERDREIRDVLFPDDQAMPAGCNIKGKFAVRARVTGNLGIYHLQACRSYPGLTNPDRWFCSEEDAQAAGFRRAYNCRPGAKSK